VVCLPSHIAVLNPGVQRVQREVLKSAAAYMLNVLVSFTYQASRISTACTCTLRHLSGHWRFSRTAHPPTDRQPEAVSLTMYVSDILEHACATVHCATMVQETRCNGASHGGGLVRTCSDGPCRALLATCRTSCMLSRLISVHYIMTQKLHDAIIQTCKCHTLLDLHQAT
jgi:hypothetical protein